MNSTQTAQKRTLLILMVGLAFCGFYVFFFEPIDSQIELLESEIKNLEREIQHHENQLVDREEMKARVKKLKNNMYNNGQGIQTYAHLEGIRQRVTNSARKYQLEISVWRPERLVEDRQLGVNKKFIYVQVEGGYHRIAKFFAHVLRLPDVLGIFEFNMAAAEDGTEQLHLRTDFVLTTLGTPTSEELSKLVRHSPKQEFQRAGL